MQGAHQGHHHHPPRLTRLLVALAGALVVAPAAHAASPHALPLPSPLAPLSVVPPVGGGATTSAEARRHRVTAATTVRVSVDASSGAPFRVRATQRLTVKIAGDYFYSIGAPLTDVREAAGSERAPGLRAAAILWQGFNPGTRVLAATAELEPGEAAKGLPLRVRVTGAGVVLENTTAVTVSAYEAGVQRADVETFLASLRGALAGGPAPLSNTVRLTTAVTQARVSVSSPLQVTGTIGDRRVDLLLGGTGAPLQATFPPGPVRLVVRPHPPTELLGSAQGLAGKPLLRRAVLASLEYARWTQYEQYLGNPDPSGTSRTSYVYATATRTAPPVVAVHTFDRNRSHTWLIALGALLVALVALVAWSRA